MEASVGLRPARLAAASAAGLVDTAAARLPAWEARQVAASAASRQVAAGLAAAEPVRPPVSRRAAAVGQA
jgi:hypothetical protein